MPRTATMSIAGLYNYDDTIFEGFRVPESIESRRQDIIDEICLEAAELTLLYTDANVMKFAITKWCNLNFRIWEELQATREYVYNPIWNKDGTYTEIETRNLAGSRTGSGSEAQSSGVQGSEQNTHQGSASGTDTHQVEGFNSTEWADANKDIRSATESATDNSTSSQITQGQGSYSNSEQTTDTGTITHRREEKGNIGVTTTQQMIKEQREVVQFSTERFIIDSFIDRFCLLVY